MAPRQWTILVMSDNEDVRQFQLSREVLRGSIGLSLFAASIVIVLATMLFIGRATSLADDRLIARNHVLERELDDMAARLDTLDDWLGRLATKDEQYRLIAGLDPLDRDVLLAGIGGPDADSLEASALYSLDRQIGATAFTASLQVNSLIRRASVLLSSWSEAEHVLGSKHARLAATPSIVPTRGYVSSSFSMSRLHPILHRPRPHMGIDIVAPVGTPVVATANGRVAAAASRGDYGLLVEIDHGHGIVTRYAHLSRLAVRAGQPVVRGQEIGAVGTSGLSAGPHLHYEVLVNGRYANPKRYILETDVIRD